MAADVASTIEFGPGIGSNPAIGIPLTEPDQTKDYIYTGPGRMTPGIPQILVHEVDDVTRAFGFKVYEAMLTDPAVFSSYLALKLAILSGPIRVMPSVRPKGFREGQKFNVEKKGSKLSEEEKRSLEMAEFVERDLKRLRKHFKSTLLQLLDMMAYGHVLAEKTREEIKVGPDAGKLGLKSIKTKPTWAWKFVVDGTLNVVGILTYVPPDILGRYEGLPTGLSQTGGFFIVPAEKFVLATWMEKDGDPRGQSALRAAYDWWNLKRQIMPFYYQHLRRFGSPSLDGELAEGDTVDRPPLDPNTGMEIPNVPLVNPATRMTQALLAYQNNSVIVRPAGSKLNVMEPKSNGEAFLNGFDLFDRQICLAIGLQVRASLEAKHGSKADSEQASDTRALAIDWGQESLGAIVTRQIAYDSILLNFGEEAAELYTPQVMTGRTEKQDKPTMWTAAGGLGFTIGQSQFEELDAELGLPERDAEADLAAEQEAAQHAADLATQVKGAGPSGAGSGGAGSSGAGGGPPGGRKAEPAKGPADKAKGAPK